jgi:S1-C subfamily serine protease
MGIFGKVEAAPMVMMAPIGNEVATTDAREVVAKATAGMEAVEVVVKAIEGKVLGLALRNNLIVEHVNELHALCAGFKIGDQLIQVDGVPVESLADLTSEWNGGAKARGNGSVTFLVLRAPKAGKLPGPARI